MQRFGKILLVSCCWLLAACFLSTAWGEQVVTMTLLPAKYESKPISGDLKSPLWIRNSPKNDSFLQFDLSRLPEGLEREDFLRCTLRLVAAQVSYNPNDGKNAGAKVVLVKGQPVNNDFSGDAAKASIVALDTLSDTNNIAINRKASDKFIDAVFAQYKSRDRKMSLRLFSDSHKASALFYAAGDRASTASDSPRLVIAYRPKPQSLMQTLAWQQAQHDPEHTGRSPWRPSRTPTGFSLKPVKVNGNGSIAGYPLLYQGNLYLVYKELDKNYLVALNYKGAELWRAPICTDGGNCNGTVQRSPVISPGGIFYVLWEGRIAGYDLNQAGKQIGHYALEAQTKAADFTDLTLANDGSLFLAVRKEDLNYIYGFTPDLQPLLSAGPFGKGNERNSTVTVSADGRNIFAQTPGGAVVFDIHDPLKPQQAALLSDVSVSEAYYHMPVAGADQGTMMFANYSGTDMKGNLWSVSSGLDTIWDSPGSASLPTQPVLGAEDKVYFIQDGVLKSHPYNRKGQPKEVGIKDSLNSTSNLIADGADNIYFWDNGTIWLADTHAGSAFATKINDGQSNYTGPEKLLRLLLGPDGTLWANNNNGKELFAFIPRYAESDLVLGKEDLKTQTYYRTEKDLRAGPQVVKPGTQLLLQAGNSIGLGKGFSVQKGASLVFRIDFRQAGL
jgi:hypothetical protein